MANTGASPNEVSLQVVTSHSSAPNTHLAAKAFIIPANINPINPSETDPDPQTVPRETHVVSLPIKVEQSESTVPMTATVNPQISGLHRCDMLSILEWKDGRATLPGSNLKFRVNEFGSLEVANTEVMPGVRGTEVAVETSVETEESDAWDQTGWNTASGCERNEKGVSSLKELPKLGSVCCCENCGLSYTVNTIRSQGHFCSEHCLQQFKEKSLRMESAAVKRSAGAILKRVKKRKRKMCRSPRTESDEEYGYEFTESEQVVGISSMEKNTLWSWVSYLESEKAVPAPVKLFRECQLFPQNKNSFRVGMKLEGIDPTHPSMYFVLTVSEVCGYRLRLHFDGYSECHDFWVNADSLDIHPAGWCEKTGHRLYPPKGYKEEEFKWANYLRITKSQAAPKQLFCNQSNSVIPLGFRVGMKLEAVDRMNPSLICVATVTDIVDNRFLVHFDNWDDTYDYWCDASSPYIHPVGWCQEHGKTLTPPQGHPHPEHFSWDKYLEGTGSCAAPVRAFKIHPPHGFQINMKLEAVDRRNSMLIRVATIVDVDDHRIKIHFDGWSHVYNYWVDADNPDIHPVGWCARTGYPLHPPVKAVDFSPDPGQVGCPVPGYKAVGHTKGSKYTSHHRKCPTPGCDGSGHVTGKFTAHHRLSGCPLAERNQARVKAEASDTDGSSRKRNFMSFGRRRKSNHHGRIGRPPKYHKLQHEDLKVGFQSFPNDGLQHVLHQSVFMSAMSPHPGRSLPLCWEQHCKLLPGVSGISASRVAQWTVEEVGSFVQTLTGSEHQAKLFKEELIDGEALLLLNQADIVKIMSIKLGPALKIYNSILMFKSADDILK
ncbi:lethal(3)malignant brain tumor-like protein 1 isoform X2 [Callorhinchus milii]|uniref:lethal(3)malignant brain tumor-like protein 1 isoform X2 n=1 Tax=Callorhinchus milii TaxID=7868 RepID=UPI001C3F719F|nr:lethal(3)malignant brain tumor-like protein 1 isoform X2 [Callorhinchus milii]